MNEESIIMSNTRHEEKNTTLTAMEKNPAPAHPKYASGLVNGVHWIVFGNMPYAIIAKQALLISTIASTINYGIQKYMFVCQTQTHASWASAFQATFAKFTQGYGMTLINSSAKTASTLVFRQLMQNLLDDVRPQKEAQTTNRAISAAIGGIAGTFVTYPLATIKARRFDGQDWQTIWKLTIKELYKGAVTTMIRNGLHWCSLLSMRDQMKHMFHYTAEHYPNSSVNYLNNSLFIGLVTGTFAAIITNPVAVIATNQKITGDNAFKTCAKLIQKHGLLRAPVLGVSGAAAMLVVEAVVVSAVLEKIEHPTPKKPSL